jgi:hypothetical protein
MADILAERCREPSWVRTSIATLERFREMTGTADLEGLRERALADPGIAERALADFARVLSGYTDSQVSGLAMGAKIWFRLSGVNVHWRPLLGGASAHPLPSSEQGGTERVILLALIGSGLRVAELLRLSIGDVGALDETGHLIPDIEADPLAVQYTPRRGKQGERVTFLTYDARRALLKSLQRRTLDGQALDPAAPLIAAQDARASIDSVARARRRSQSLIRAGSDVNVALCRTTGDFFREWGLPGSRFEGVDDLNLEEYI